MSEHHVVPRECPYGQVQRSQYGQEYDTSGAGLRNVCIDSSIAGLIDELNEAGYKTYASCSGIVQDHPGQVMFDEESEVSDMGYIAFKRLSPEREKQIKKAAQIAGLDIQEEDISGEFPELSYQGVLIYAPPSLELAELSGDPDFPGTISEVKLVQMWGKFKNALLGNVASTHPLVLERFPYPAPDQMELGGDIGKIKVTIPPPRGIKLPEGSVIRTSEKHDKAVEHLGYHSVSLSEEEVASLETKAPTDIEIIRESQSRLREAKIIPDDHLNPTQRAHLNLARAIAREVDCVPLGGIHAAIIPPASDRVKTAGLYGTKTGSLFLSIDMLSRGRDAFDTLVHELGHHRQYCGSGEAEDLTPAHAAAMKNIAEGLIQGLNSGKYNKLLVETLY